MDLAKAFLKGRQGEVSSVRLLTPEGSDRRYFRIKVLLGAPQASQMPPQAQQVRNKKDLQKNVAIKSGTKARACAHAQNSSMQNPPTVKKLGSLILAESSLSQRKKFLLRHEDFSRAGLNVPWCFAVGKKALSHLLGKKAGSVGLARARQRGGENKKPQNQKLKTKNHPSSAKAFLLLEDLGDRSLERQVWESNKFPAGYYRQALDQALRLTRAQVPWRVRAGDFFREMLFAEEHLMQGFLRFKPARGFRDEYRREWKKLCRRLGGCASVPAHRDFHSRNLFIKNKKIYLIDFQDARLFPRFYDAVSLLYDVYVLDKMSVRQRRNLKNYFLAKAGLVASGSVTGGGAKAGEASSGSVPGGGAKAGGVASGSVTGGGAKAGGVASGSGSGSARFRSEAMREFDLTGVQRLFKACGSFAGFYMLKKQSSHLKFVPPGLKMLEALLEKQQNEYPGFYRLVKTLSQRVKEKNIKP